MMKQIIILIVEISIIVGALVFYKKTMDSVKEYFRKRNEEYKNEITDQIKVFLLFYNKFERYLDKEMWHDEFFADLKLKELVGPDEDVINIPFGCAGLTLSVRDTFDLRYVLRVIGETIYEKDDLFNQYYKVKVEQLEIYCEFSKKFRELNLICSKHARKEKEIRLDTFSSEYGIIEQF